MSAVETSREAVDRLATRYERVGMRDDALVAATLRALLAEREALARTLEAKEAAAQDALQQAWAEREALQERVSDLGRAARIFESKADAAYVCERASLEALATSEAERDAARAEVARLREAILSPHYHDAALVPMRLRLMSRTLAEPTP